MRKPELTDKYRQLILDYKAKYPMLKMNQLAELMLKEEKIPHTMDSFRKIVNKVFNESVKIEPMSLEDPKEEDFLLPRSDYKDVPFFRLPKSCDNILALFDIHLPYHASRPLVLALKYGKEHGINTIFLGGDTLDCYELSKFVKNPHYRNTLGEIEIAKQFLAELRKKFPNAKIYFKIGNHERRLDYYIWRNAAALADYKALAFDQMLDFSLYGIELIQFNQVTLAGHLNIVHGHELPGGGINIARTKRLKAFDNIMFGHHHFTQTDVARTVKDKQIGSWAVGCLCGTKPDFSPINNWTNGFAHVKIDSTGSFSVYNKMIVDGIIR